MLVVKINKESFSTELLLLSSPTHFNATLLLKPFFLLIKGKCSAYKDLFKTWTHLF